MPAWDYDCIVVGAGPGGLVSALYLRRFRRKVLLVSSGRPRAYWAPRIRNLLGYTEGIPGRVLIQRISRQIDALGKVDRLEAQVTVSRRDAGFEVVTDSGHALTARKVILATGIHDVHPKVDNLIDLRRRGLLKYCSICDGYEVRDRPVAVLAQDDFGIQKALFIGHWTPHIRIYVPKDMKLAPQRVREIRALGAKVIRCDTLTMEPIESSTGGSPGLCVRADGRKPFACSVAYVELGSRVNDSAFKGLKKLRRSKEGFLITTTEQRTSIPGLFAVGDCVNLLGQVSVAAGQAAVAATTIHNDLLEAG